MVVYYTIGNHDIAEVTIELGSTYYTSDLNNYSYVFVLIKIRSKIEDIRIIPTAKPAS